MATRLLIALVVPHDWERIELVRTAVGACAFAVYGDDELRDALSMVAAELLENAIKYGSAHTDVELSIRDDAGALTVTVANGVDAGSPHLPKLSERLEWLRSFADPAQAYTRALTSIYGDGTIEGSSGLGIVRIAYEGGCSVECDLSRVGQVTVHARRLRQRGDGR
jgi:anti-sigma regulatory factor (Ser/Thr protein kinase)